MSDECRHGFEAGLCAICYPPKTPETSSAPRETASRTSTPRASTRASSRTSTARGSASVAKPVRVDQMRLYHVTHVRNLPSILAGGSILSDDLLHDDERSDAAQIMLSSAENRAARRRITIEDAAVSAYVPLFLSPDAAVWSSIRSRTPNVRISAEAARLAPNDFVMLVTSVASLRALDAEVVVADGDAAAGLTRFAADPVQADRMLARFALDADDAAQSAAEVLVRDELPLTALSMIGVASIQLREKVKRMLADAGLRTKVATYQPWFAPSA
ncbi:DarT ssDNA thymidine ADP-ribosyltransferase family protein [Paramicrobacterium humi]|uniref:DarT ssDNA thymidine ADP-ribosyltransferase family protein n=1 Tax=Paramicrobacterium humi TaxID=640635 RepID=UPI0015A029DE|nr:DarT ssDNA thymidine ADP-ribosyltransferase family protein [Microbacterium humi]